MRLFAFVLALLASGQALVIETNVDEIVTGKTENVEIQCKHNTSKNDPLAKGKMLRIRVVKIDVFGHKKSLAELRTAANEIYQEDDDLLVTWGKDEQQVYLKITWPVATESTAGAYACEIHGYDENDEFINQEVSPRLIKEKALTIDDVSELIRSLTLDMYQKQDELEWELARLRTIANKEMVALRQELQDYDDKQKQEIANLEEMVDSKYTTKREVSGRLSELKEFTMTELMSERKSVESKQERFSNAIRNTSIKCQEKFTETSSELAAIRTRFTNKIVSLEEESEKANGQVDSTFKQLRQEVHLVDIKYGRSINNLSENFKKRLSENVCPCRTSLRTPTPPVTPPLLIDDKTKSRQRKSIDWPDGAFGLVEPRSGCPEPKQLTVNGRRLFDSEAYYDNSRLFKSKHNDDLKKLFKVYVSSGKTKSELSYCYKEESSGTHPWPKGRYCINRQDSCPANFTGGHTMYFSYAVKDKKKTYQGIFTVRYCCRSDGQASSPIQLATEKPFYLFRHKGACQQVEGMRVTDHFIQITLGKDIRMSKLPMGTQPDMNTKGDIVSLCYYHTSITGDSMEITTKERRPKSGRSHERNHHKKKQGGSHSGGRSHERNHHKKKQGGSHSGGDSKERTSKEERPKPGRSHE